MFRYEQYLRDWCNNIAPAAISTRIEKDITQHRTFVEHLKFVVLGSFLDWSFNVITLAGLVSCSAILYLPQYQQRQAFLIFAQQAYIQLWKRNEHFLLFVH